MKTYSEMQFTQATRVVPKVRWTEVPEAELATRFALSGPTMGTRFSAVFYAAADTDTSAILRVLQAAVDRVDTQMSNWKSDSDLSRFNAAPVGVSQQAPAELFEVVSLGLDIGRASGGIFDLGMGERVAAWGFGPDGRSVGRPGDPAPPHGGLACDGLRLDPATRSIRKLAPIALDLSGIAKGYGVDRLAEALEASGISRYLVSIDGEVRCRGSKPGDVPWAVALERPVQRVREVARVLEIADVALATSGDYRHFAEVDGKMVSHSIDPRTGRPVENAVASVTVAAPSCVLADAWATALLVAGEVGGPALARRLGIDALFLIRDGDGHREVQVGAGD